MATGDLTVFNEFLISVGEKLINLETDTIKLGLINDTVTPQADTATPTWDGTSSQEFDGNEVSPIIGDYSAGGLTISGPSFTRTANVAKFDDDNSNLSIAQNAGGFIDAYWGIMYSETAAARNCIAFIELGGPVSQVAGPITITFDTDGILTMTN